ncbi:hypothetical protein N2152v2_003130 [Parachlorella kessleri]
MRTEERSIIIFCMGTRGDVQPFVALGLGLVDRGWTVTIAAPLEFHDFVSSFGLAFADIGRSLQKEMLLSPEGKALRTVGPLGLRAAAKAFFNVPLSGSGFSARWAFMNRMQWATSSALVGRGIHAHTARQVVQLAAQDLQAQYQRLLPGPSLELGEQFGTANLPQLYIYSSHLLPKPADWPDNCHVVGPLLLRPQQAGGGGGGRAKAGQPQASGAGEQASSTGLAPARLGPWSDGKRDTDESSCGLSGEPSGETTAGSLSQQASAQPCSLEDSGDFLIPSSRPPVVEQAGGASSVDGPLTTASEQQGGKGNKGGSLPGCSAGSSNAKEHGPQVTAASAKAGTDAALQPAEPPVGLPAALQSFLDYAFRRQLLVIYIGLGSMLGTVFEPEQVSSILDCICEAVVQLSARWPVRAVIHTTLGGGRSGQPTKAAAAAGAPFMLLDQPVAHNLLLPQVVPCVPASDQSFWADLVWRLGLGPLWFPVAKLTVSRLVAGLEEGLQRLDELTRNAEEMAADMHHEDGVKNAIAVIESAAGVTHGRLAF